MKRAILIIVMVVCALFTACGGGRAQDIVLSFDRTSAYFTGSERLIPIVGALPDAGDVFEEATIKMTANTAVRMQLKAEFKDEDAIAGLMILVNGSEAVAFVPGIIIYESLSEEASATLKVCLFLASDTLAAESADKSLNFELKLSYFQN